MTKDERIEFYEDQEFQKIVSVFYGLVSAVAIISFHLWLQHGSGIEHLSGLSFVLFWAIITIVQTALHFRGYKITLLNGLLMINAVIFMIAVGVIGTIPLWYPYR